MTSPAKIALINQHIFYLLLLQLHRKSYPAHILCLIIGEVKRSDSIVWDTDLQNPHYNGVVMDSGCFPVDGFTSTTRKWLSVVYSERTAGCIPVSSVIVLERYLNLSSWWWKVSEKGVTIINDLKSVILDIMIRSIMDEIPT